MIKINEITKMYNKYYGIIKCNGSYLVKDTDGSTYIKLISNDIVCDKCAFISLQIGTSLGGPILRKCRFLENNDKCPMAGIGYFINISEGI